MPRSGRSCRPCPEAPAGLTDLSQGSDNTFDPQGIDQGETCGFRRRAFRAGWVSVITIEHVEDFPARARGAYVTVGNFDGVHRGHQRLIGRLRARADAAGVPALAVTFDPHPVALLRPDKAPVPLVWPEREVALLEETGATEVAAFRTGRWLLDLTAREFFDRVIRRQFAARGMVEGPNFAFGHDRQGNVEILGGWCAAAGIEFEVVEPTSDHGQLISSSRIRQSLHEGKVEEASRFLGRPHRIRGVVTHGAGRGAGLGIPTINVDGIDTLIPLDGVYAARVFVAGAESCADGKRRDAIFSAAALLRIFSRFRPNSTILESR